jgi:hypothetical protein
MTMDLNMKKKTNVVYPSARHVHNSSAFLNVHVSMHPYSK